MTIEGFPGVRDGKTIQFTGKERDAETGLDFFQARFLSAAQGGFILIATPERTNPATLAAAAQLPSRVGLASRT